MGTGVSDLHGVHENPEVAKFVSAELIAPNDPFWDRLLSFKLKRKPSRTDDKALSVNAEILLSAFLKNNPKTGNLASLIRIFSLKAADLKSSLNLKCPQLVRETLSAALLVRHICQLSVTAPDEEELVRQCCALPLPAGVTASATSNPLQRLAETLLELATSLPLQENTYFIHLEVLNILLVLLSCQMYTTRQTHELPVYTAFMTGRCAAQAAPLVKTLLRRVSARDRASSWDGSAPDESGGGGGGLARGLAGGLWSALTLGLGSLSDEESADDDWPPVARQSLLLLLVLGNHCTNDKHLQNPYRQAMFQMVNFHDPTEPELVDEPYSFRLDLGRLLNSLCALPASEPATLLLYLLLHNNTAFRTYTLSRTDVDTLVMSTLLTLYAAPEISGSRQYMSLIVLLILTEDPLFSRTVHDSMLKSVPWFTERPVSDISVGSLVVLVVSRAIQHNMTKTRCKYLHTNCLAALANMSAEFRRLHPYACQRMVTLFEMLSRKHSRQLQLLQQDEPPSAAAVQDVMMLEDVLKTLLEVLNSCLTTQLVHNPNLVYALLYKRDIFRECQVHASLQPIARNIDTVLLYFQSKVDGLSKEPSVKDVLTLIEEGAKMFPADKLKKFPELRFKYVEEVEPEAFFIPYVWQLIYSDADLHWAPDNICLFSLTDC